MMRTLFGSLETGYPGDKRRSTSRRENKTTRHTSTTSQQFCCLGRKEEVHELLRAEVFWSHKNKRNLCFPLFPGKLIELRQGGKIERVRYLFRRGKGSVALDMVCSRKRLNADWFLPRHMWSIDLEILKTK